MATKKCLLRKVDRNLLRDRKVGQQHKLFDECVRSGERVVVAVGSDAFFVQSEHQLVFFDTKGSVLEAALTQVLGQFLKAMLADEG